MDRKPKQVKLPFYERFRRALLDGRKTATTRTRRFGKPGDWFPAYGATFKILAVAVCNLSFVEKFYYEQEGFKKPAGFVNVWIEIHPGNGWVPSQEVYLHIFERMENQDGQGKDQAGIPFED